jgi:hypothetical protein
MAGQLGITGDTFDGMPYTKMSDIITVIDQF